MNDALSSLEETPLKPRAKTQAPFPPKVKKATFRGWTVWFMAAVFYLYEYILRASPAVMTHQLMQDFAVGSASLGLLSSMYYYAYTPLQIPCGLIVDRLGARFVVTVSCILCLLGTFLFSQSESFLLAQIGRMIIGAGSACAFLCALKLISDWFPARYFAVVSGMTTMLGITAGGYLAGKPLALFVNESGWREALMWMSLFGILVAFLCWLVIANTPWCSIKKKLGIKETSTQEGYEGTVSTETIIKDIKILIKNPQTWLISGYGALFYVTISAFAEMWGVPYMMKKYALDNANAAGIIAMLFLGKGLGAPGLALLSNYLKSRKKIMFFSTLAATTFFLIAIYGSSSVRMMEVLLFCTGICVGGQVLCFALNQEANPKEISATTAGFTNMGVMMSGLILLPALGAILDLNWDGIVDAHGGRIYTLAAYENAMMALPACLFGAWIISLFIKETYVDDEDLDEDAAA